MPSKKLGAVLAGAVEGGALKQLVRDAVQPVPTRRDPPTANPHLPAGKPGPQPAHVPGGKP